MYKQYIKQALQLLKDNKLLTIISISGTALSIAMIMCIVLIYTARTGNYEPEVHKDRTVSVHSVIARNKQDEGWNNGGMMSLRVIKECFYNLQSAEAVAAVAGFYTFLATSPGIENEAKCITIGTDDSFWKIFQFRFLHGKPYGEEFASGERKAVITRSIARKIFGEDNVVGKTITLSFVDYTVCGVVADVSILAEDAYAEAWVPYTTLDNYESSSVDGLLHQYICHILAPKASDVDIVRQEAQRNVDMMNESQKDFKLVLSGAPDTRLMSMAREDFFEEPDVKGMILSFVLVILVLLIVPAINLGGINLSKMRRRMEEIGIRRAFGSTRSELFRQILTEHFILTLIGGVVGLILSYFAVLGLREWLLNTTMAGFYGVDTAVTGGMIVRLDVFIFALLFCFLLNLLSAGIPAWKISRSNIVNAIN